MSVWLHWHCSFYCMGSRSVGLESSFVAIVVSGLAKNTTELIKPCSIYIRRYWGEADSNRRPLRCKSGKGGDKLGNLVFAWLGGFIFLML